MDRLDAHALATSMHIDLFRQPPDRAQADGYTALLEKHGDRSAILREMMSTDEYLDAVITSAYEGTTGRKPTHEQAADVRVDVRSGALRIDHVPVRLLEAEAVDGRRSFASFLALLYHVAHGRCPAVREAEYWREWVGNDDRIGLIRTIWEAEEAVRHRLARLYRTHLWRNPDGEGFRLWAARITSVGDDAVREAIVSSQEYLNLARARAGRANLQHEPR